MALLEVNKIAKQFVGLRALQEITFSLKAGEIAGVIGPNGAGKTTLFNVISGYYQADSGNIIFKGQEITRLDPHSICRRGIARTFQICKPFPQLSVRENIIVGACHWARSIKEAKEAAERTIEIVGLDMKKNLLGESLSTPDRKKLELGRALVTNPTLLLLDEPAAGLNPTEVSAFLNMVGSVAANNSLTILIVEHILEVIMNLCSRVIVLEDGEKIADGSPEEVAQDPRVVAAYLGDEYAIAKGR